MSMYEYLEREQQREIEAGWEGDGEIVDWAEERAWIEAEHQAHCKEELVEWLRCKREWLGDEKPCRSIWEAL